MALRIGLTGGIGSGKTVISRVFQTLGIPVYYSDTEARHLMNQDPSLRSQITALFGEAAYVNNMLDRSFLASLVFEDRDKLNALNAMVHPVTINASDRWMKSQTAPYAIKEAALIFESGADSALDYVVGVTAPESLRLQRVMQRDHIGPEQVKRRMSSQLDEAEKMKRCHFVIINDEQHAVIPQVIEIHQQLLALTAS